MAAGGGGGAVDSSTAAGVLLVPVLLAGCFLRARWDYVKLAGVPRVDVRTLQVKHCLSAALSPSVTAFHAGFSLPAGPRCAAQGKLPLVVLPAQPDLLRLPLPRRLPRRARPADAAFRRLPGGE